MMRYENTDNPGIANHLCGRIFHTEKLKKIVEKINVDLFIGEDANILFHYVITCRSIYLLHICTYHYEDNANS